MTSPNDTNDFFADCTDFDLCNALSVVIENHYDFDELLKRAPHIPHERWVIHIIWALMDCLMAKAIRTFGVHNCTIAVIRSSRGNWVPIEASIIRDAIALVPPHLLGNWDAVEDHTKSEKARDKAAEHMDEMLISDHPDFSGNLGRYARDRHHSFADLLDALKRQRKFIDDGRKQSS